MIAAAALLAYAAALLTAGPRALAWATWPDRAPRLAISAWLALAGSAVASVVLAGVALLTPTAGISGGLAQLLTDCLMPLEAPYAHPGQMALAVAGAVLAVTVTARVAWCTAATLAGAGRAARRHRRRLRLAGHPDTRLGAYVIDHDEPAAYCLPGARYPVVLTTAAIQALDGTQLAAVLAHERAHQAGRHHLLVALATALAAAFPPVPAFRHARDQVTRLAELAADDAAAAVSPRLAVASALLTLASAPAAAGTLAADGPAAAARIHRLIATPRPLRRAATAAGLLAVTALIALPLAVLAAPVSAGDRCPHQVSAAPAVLVQTAPSAAVHPRRASGTGG